MNLFDNLNDCYSPLTQKQRIAVAKRVIYNAKLGYKYFYSQKEVCLILHKKMNSIRNLIRYYRLDAILFLGTYRIPWYDLAGFLLENPSDPIRRAFNEYTRTLSGDL